MLGLRSNIGGRQSRTAAPAKDYERSGGRRSADEYELIALTHDTTRQKIVAPLPGAGAR